MRIATLDFESWWDVGHTLSKMSPVEYVMHPDTELISCSIKLDGGPTEVFFGEPDIAVALRSLNWSNTAVLAHNVAFDGLILNWRLGIEPRMYMCTAAMARPLHGKTCGVSLAKLVEHYGLGVKNNAVLMQTKGKHLADFTEAEKEQMRVYNREDTDQCYALFKKLKPHYTAKELWHIDAITRMRIDPRFEVDVPMLETALSIERDQKRKHILMVAKKLRTTPGFESSEAVMQAATIDTLEEAVRAELASAPKFAALLTACGVEVPMKPSPSNPDKQVPALAKTDEAFTDLQEHDDPIVAAATRARLAVKSTLLETRIGKFLVAANLTGGKLPVPIRYCGADTTGRDSGEEYNCMTAGHEVLTPAGWVDIAVWQPTTPIVQWWPHNGGLSWCDIPDKVAYQHDGDVIELDGPFVRGRYTPDHRVPSIRGKRGVVDRTAGWIADHSGLDGVPASGTWRGGVSKLTPAQVRLIVATSADGCEVKGGLRWGFRKQRKIDRIQQLFEWAGLNTTVRVYDYRDRPDNHWLATLSPGKTPTWLVKGFGPWILGLSRVALDAFVDELRHWDGMGHSKTGNTCFFTSHQDQAEWVSTALHLSGKPARIGHRKPGKIDVYARSTPTTSVTGKRVPFSGPVYCPKVNSSYVLVRYQGAIHVTGNCQNLPRVNPSAPKTSDALRNCLRAPRGHKIIVSDLSGIEMRVNHFLWKVESSVALFQNDVEADLYKDFAATRYGIPPSEVTKTQRQWAKCALLGLGFGAGAPTFKRFAKAQFGISMEDDEALITVESWREKYSAIVQGWKLSGLGYLAAFKGQTTTVDPWGMVTSCPEGLRLPSGRLIRYPHLRMEEDGFWPDGRAKKSMFYAHGRHKARITPPKCCENLVQAIARDIIFDDALLFYKSTGLRPQLRVHDELVYVVPDSEAQPMLDELQRIMRTPPTWWPELIVWSEGDIGQTYGGVK